MFIDNHNLADELIKIKDEVIPGEFNLLVVGSGAKDNVFGIASFLKESGMDAVGNKAIVVDINESPLIRQRMSAINADWDRKMKTSLHFASMDARQIALADKSVDAMIYDNTIAFCQDGDCIKKSFMEIGRLLKQQGVVFIKIPYIDSTESGINNVKEFLGVVASKNMLHSFIKDSGLSIRVIGEENESIKGSKGENIIHMTAVLTKK